MGASAISTDDSGASVTTGDLYPEADLHRLQNAVRVLLSGVGENISREGLQDTPKRVAKAWVDVSSGYRQDLHSVLGGAIFHEPIVSEGSGSMVIVRDIEFASTSEANLLPFYGRCHVAYVPSNGVVLGLSKLARVTKLFASQLQSQQRLTSQILVALQQELAPKGAAIVMEAHHLAHGPEADLFMTSASSGCFQDISSSCMQEFLCMLQLHGTPVPSSALPRVPKDSSTLLSPLSSSSSSPHPSDRLPASHDHNVKFMSSMGSRRIFARNGGSGTVASVHQFQLEDTATTMDADESAMQSTVQDMEAAVAVILQEIGEDIERPELQGTPQRYVQLLLASTSGAKQQPVPDFHQQLMQAESASSPHAHMSHDTDMPAAASHMDACAEPSTPNMQEWHVQFASQCEHHMLPFHGRARIIIVHSSHSQKLTLEQVKALILSFSHRLQIQERLTNQLADAIQVVTGALGCVITCEAAHMCMVARGVEKHASSTITLASRGLAAQDSVLRGKLLLRLSQKRISV